MRYFSLIAALQALGFTAPGLFAVSALGASIETLVVTGRATEEQPWRLSRDLAKSLPSTGVDTGDRLQGLAGLQVDSRSNLAQDTRITLRGFGARSAFGVRGVLLQRDGVPLSMPDGQGQLSGVALDDVTQVSLIRGPVAALFGNGAGGVLALSSALPAASGAALSSSADGLGSRRQSLSGQWRQATQGLRLQAHRLRSDGWRQQSAASRDQLAAEAFLAPENGIQGRLRLDYEDAPELQDPQGLSLDQWRANPEQTHSSASFFKTQKAVRHRQASLSLQDTGPKASWQLATWAGQRDIQQALALRGDAPSAGGGWVDLSRHFAGANGNRTWHAHWGAPLDLSLGAQWAQQRDARLGWVNNAGVPGALRRDESARAQNRDLYAISQWQLSPNNQFLGGLRRSQVDFQVDDHYLAPGNGDDSGAGEFADTLGALAWVYRLSPQWRTDFSLGEGFETPTLTELAYRREGAGLNTQLRPAQQRQAQWQWDYQGEQLQVQSALFAIDSRDDILVDLSQGGRTSYKNAAQTRRQGLETQWTWQPTPHWSLDLAAHYLDAHFSQGDLAGLDLPGVARHQGQLQLRYTPLGEGPLRISLAATRRAAIATDDLNTQWAPALTRWDLALEGRLAAGQAANWHWWCRLNNLTDEQAVGAVIVNTSNGRSIEPAPGRHWAAGLRLAW
jgi:iron complex outermembrane recepter protein